MDEEIPEWAEDGSEIIIPKGWTYVQDAVHGYGTCAVYRNEEGREVHVELPDPEVVG